MRYLTLLLVLSSLVGCQSGTTYEMLVHDNVIAAATEVQKGVDAFNETIVTDTEKRQNAMIDAIGQGIKDVAQDNALDEEQATALALKVTGVIRQHLANYAEQERRRREIYEAITDNLLYIIQISRDAKQFILYRADVDEQWRAYLDSSLKNYIGE